MNRKLYRSKTDCIIAGVAGGLADYFEIDVTIVRLLWVMAVFLGGTGVLAYLAAWLIIPPAPDSPLERRDPGAQPIGTGAGQGDTTEQGHASEQGYISEQGRTEVHNHNRYSAEYRRRTFGWILIVIGILFLVRNYWPWVDMDLFWPVILVLIGVVLIAGGFKGGRRA
ncbi:MAG: PspC domain-containing protein [Firmicutes bacterium]|nr:PspC domain-containing protein [Bacillota bacterium]